jgi:hypothetical protein
MKKRDLKKLHVRVTAPRPVHATPKTCAVNGQRRQVVSEVCVDCRLRYMKRLWRCVVEL